MLGLKLNHVRKSSPLVGAELTNWAPNTIAESHTHGNLKLFSIIVFYAYDPYFTGDQFDDEATLAQGYALISWVKVFTKAMFMHYATWRHSVSTR